MARDGSGNYNLVSGNPVVTNTVIASTWANNTLSDIAAALTQSLSKDGQTTPTADLTMGNFKLRNVASAIARTDAPNVGQIQDGGLITLSGVSGTNAITAATSPAITAYAAGQQFRFVAVGTITTGVPTLNINGLGAKNLTRLGGQGFISGDIQSGSVITATYDGTQFQITGFIGASGVVGAVRNLFMNVPAASVSATMTADEITLQPSLGGAPFKLNNFLQNINLSTTGVPGGMDTGSAPISGYVALYAIYSPSAGAALLAKNATSATQPNIYGGANMPAGYTASALVSVVPTNASGQFAICSQIDRKIFIPPVTAFTTSSTVSTLTAQGIPNAVPLNARTFGGSCGATNSTAGAGSTWAIAGSSSGIGQVLGATAAATANTGIFAPYDDVPLLQTQVMYFVNNPSGGASTFTANVSRYTI